MIIKLTVMKLVALKTNSFVLCQILAISSCKFSEEMKRGFRFILKILYLDLSRNLENLSFFTQAFLVSRSN